MDKINRSVDILKCGKIDYEFRTTTLKDFHEISDFEKIGKWLQGDSRYFIQCFKDSGDTIGKGLLPFNEAELNSFKLAVLPYLPRTELRGI